MIGSFPAFSNKSAKIRKTAARLILIAAAFALGNTAGIFFKNNTAFGQSDQKKVSLEARKTLNEQIRFSDLRIGGLKRAFEEGLSENKGWLGRTSFQIENISIQDITYMRLKIAFPETEATGPVMAYTFSLGKRPGSLTLKSEPFLFRTGEKMTVDISAHYPQIVKFLAERHLIDDLNKVELEASFIVFADGTGWAAGAFMRQDPDNPNRWVQVDMPGYVPTKPRRRQEKP